MPIFQNTANTLMYILTDSGVPVTGLTHTDIEVYLVKNGTSSTYTLTAPDISEVDSTNIPGAYAITLPSGSFDTVGSLYVYLKSSADPTDFDDTVQELFVQQDYQSKLDTLDTNVSSNGTALAQLATEHITMDGKLDQLLTDVDALDLSSVSTSLTTIEGKIDTIDTVVDANKASLDALDVSGIISELESISTDIQQILGLNKSNFMMDTLTYDSSGRALTGRTRVWGQSDTVGVDPPILTLNFTATYSSEGRMTSLTSTKQ